VSQELIGLLYPMLVALALAVARIGAAAFIVPFLGGQVLSGAVRNAVIISIAIPVVPLIQVSLAGTTVTPLALLGLVAKEVFLGILIGFLSSIAFWGAIGVGYIMDNQRGTTLASVYDPFVGEQTSPTGQFLQIVLIVLFYTSGGLHLFFDALYESYRIWPPGTFLPRPDARFPLFVLEQTDRLMRIMVVLAAPVVIAVFLSEFGLGLISRFAPQMNAFSLSMPVKSLVGAIVLVVYLPFLLGLTGDEFLALGDMMKLLDGLLR
jgi:type III secretion protein T